MRLKIVLFKYVKNKAISCERVVPLLKEDLQYFLDLRHL